MDINIKFDVTKEMLDCMAIFRDALKGMGIAIAVTNPIKAVTGVDPEVKMAAAPVPQTAPNPANWGAMAEQAPQPPIVPTAPVAPVVPVAPPVAPVIQTAQHQYTVTEIQKACAPLVDAGRNPDIMAVLQGMGVQSLLQLDPSRYGELVIKLRALGARL